MWLLRLNMNISTEVRRSYELRPYPVVGKRIWNQPGGVSRRRNGSRRCGNGFAFLSGFWSQAVELEWKLSRWRDVLSIRRVSGWIFRHVQSPSPATSKNARKDCATSASSWVILPPGTLLIRLGTTSILFHVTAYFHTSHKPDVRSTTSLVA